MGRNKVRRLASAARLPNLLKRDQVPRGGWNQVVFGREVPLVVEVGCGRGEYSIGLAQRYPNCHFVGIDRKMLRMAQGARRALELGLENVRFLWADARELSTFFGVGEVVEIWLPFPDPHPIAGEEKRLVASGFLDIYEHILAEDGILHFKTDNELLFRYGYEQFRRRSGWRIGEVIADVHQLPADHILRAITTHYERKFASGGIPVFYLRAYRKGV